MDVGLGALVAQVGLDVQPRHVQDFGRDILRGRGGRQLRFHGVGGLADGIEVPGGRDDGTLRQMLEQGAVLAVKVYRCRDMA